MYNQGRGSGPYYWQKGNHRHLPYDLHLSAQQPGTTPFARPQTFNPLTAPSIPILITNPYAPNQFGQALSLQAAGSSSISLSYMSTQAAVVSASRALPSGANVFSAPSSTGANNISCSRPGCCYKCRSKKDLELHLMDRHFIYPPNYNPRKRKRDEGRGPDGDVARYVNCIVP
jgi:hypothetical protein